MNKTTKCFFVCLIILVMTAMPSLVFATENTTLTEEEYATIQSKPIYKVGYSAQHMPFSYTDEEGNAAGMAVSVMNVIAQEVGITIEYIPLDGDTALQGAIIDINLSVLARDILPQHNIVGAPYVTLPLMIVGQNTINSDDAVTIGSMDYLDFTNETVLERYPQSTLITCDTLEETAQMLKSGEIDYVVCTNIYAYTLQETTGQSYIVDSLGVNLPVSMTFAQWLSTDTILIFEKLLSNVDEVTMAAIVMNATKTVASSQTFVQVLVGYRYVLIGIAVFLLFLICIAVLFFQNWRKKQLLHLLDVDTLTGLISMKKFYEQASLKLKAGLHRYSVVSIDIDNFHYLNETFGFDQGTIALQDFAARLRKQFDQEDLVARFSDDKFIVFTRQIIDDQMLKEHMKNKNMTGIHLLDNQKGSYYRVYVSIGVYRIDDDRTKIPYCVDCANHARLEGKSAYGNTCHVYSPDMEMAMRVKNKIVTSMEKGIENQEFAMLYQPKVDVITGEIVGCEALVRWIHGHYDLVYPNHFIPVFEKNGFIVNLDYYVMERVCSFISNNRGRKIPPVSINVSGFTILENTLMDTLHDLVEKYQIEPANLDIEITESALLIDSENLCEQLNKIRLFGCSVSMDDFGSGMSSFGRLKTFTIDTLKIDKIFIDDIVTSQKARLILDSIIQMGKRLGITTVAEGVETKEQLDVITKLHCDEYQGYYFAKPIPQKDFLQMLSSCNK